MLSLIAALEDSRDFTCAMPGRVLSLRWMKNDIRRYIGLRDSLVREKNELEERLRQISEALGEAESRQAPSAQAASGKSAPAGKSRRGRRGGGGLSLREAVLQVVSSGALTKEEILDQVKGLGYKFSTSNPLNSLGVILYGKNPKFKNEQGRFSLAGGASSGAGKTGGKAGGNGSASNAGAFNRKRRQLSPEARERIAAAQRARWAKAKGSR